MNANQHPARRWNAVAATISFAALLVPAGRAQIATADDALAAKAKTRALDAYRTRPLSFEKNGGQTDPQVRFLARHGSSTLFLTADGAVISLAQQNSLEEFRTSALRITWKGSRPSPPVDGLDELPAKANYLIGSNPGKWRSGVPTYSRVQYRDLYSGVDLIYYGQRGELEYDLALAPGASPRPIRMEFVGMNKIEIDRSGDLILRVGGEDIRFHKPVAYQIADAGRIPIAARFVKKGWNQIGFEVAGYDRSRPLVIDPQLSYSSYLGGSGSDTGEKVAVDTNGNAYIVGVTSATDFPVVAPFQSVNRGTTNAFIAKLNPEAAGGLSLVYSTYLGGSGTNVGRAIAVDSVGQIYIAGDTNAPNFPVTPRAFQTACKLQAGVCSTDIFAAKLDATGSTLLYSTYLGGTGTEFGFTIAIDFAGHMYVGANTGSSDIPVTSGAFQTSFAGGGTKFGDAYVAELNPAGQDATDLLYATYFGGSGSEQLWSVTVDGAGAIDFTGSTASSNFPVTSSAFSTTYSGAGSLALGDAFVVKLTPTGQGAADLVYSTYLGGANDDRGEGIAVDALNRIYIAGFTGSASFPVTSAFAFQSTFGGGTCNGTPCDDAFIAKLDPSLSGAASLVYSTFLGGNSFDLGHSIALDGDGLVYVTGETGSSNFPVLNAIQSNCFGGCRPLPLDDVFIAKFDLSQTGAVALLFSTYLGGNDVDTGWSIAVDSKGDALVTGQTFSTNFPTEIPLQANCNNCSSFISSNPSGDAFLVKVCITSCPSASPVPASLAFASQNTGTTSAAQSVTFTNNGSGDLTIVAVTITAANASDFSQTNNCPSLLAPTSACQINVTFTPTAGGTRNANVSIANNGGTNPQLIGLSGTGVAPVPVVGLAPGSLSFGNQTQNTTSAAQGITVTNNGPGTLAITGIAITGSNPVDFGQTNNCPVSPVTLAVNATCTINATFTPTATGARAAFISIADNGSGSPQSVTLSGTGMQPILTPWPNGYNYQATFTVTPGKVAGTQSNFPVLISGTYPDFRSSANGGRVVNSCTQTIGDRAIAVPCDLIFTSDAAGSTLLSWEIESYNPATGALVAWVRLPGLSTGTVVYGWYSNAAVSTLQYTPTSTWNGNYLGVWHFSEDPGGAPPQMNDSTAGFSHGTSNGGMVSTDQVPGAIGGSLAFGSGKYVTFADPAMFSLDRTSTFTLEAWVKFKAKESSGILMKELGSGAFTGYGLFQRFGNTNSQVACELNNISPSSRAVVRTNNEWVPGTFHHVACVYAGTSLASGITLYVDGVAQATTVLSDTLTGSLLNTSPIEVSGRGGANFQSTATIDEPRISKSALPAGWIAAEYSNQSNPGAFFTTVIGLTNQESSPVVGLAPGSLGFGNQTQNTTSAAQGITVTNSGPGTLTINSIAITGTNPGDFGQTNNCPVSPATLAVNATCTINATFTPTATGTRAAAVSITDNGSGSPQSVTLGGTGVAPVPVVGLAPGSLSFGNQTQNTTSAAQGITVTNNGPGTLTITGIAITGSNPGDFGQTNNCPVSPATLAVNATCTINATFTPTATGTRAAAVSITDNGSGSPQSVTLSGTGVAPVPAVGLAPGSLSFGNQTQNTTSAAQGITVTNNGPGTLAITGIAITGSNPVDFGQTNNCPVSPVTLAVNATCTINATFTPAATGARAAFISITDNGSGSPQSVTLSGTGIQPTLTPWPNGYNYQATFTVTPGKVAGTQSNFPVLISGTYPDFRSSANGGRVVNSCTQTVGDRAIAVPCDLIFTSDAAGSTLLSWEIESYNPATGALVAWVRLPGLSTGTVVYGWYSNAAVSTLQYTPTSTWNGNYLGVWHFSEDPGGAPPQMNDSTAGFSHGTSNGGMVSTDQVPGAIGGSLAFGSGKYVTFADPAMFSLDRTSTFTLEAWVKFKAKESSGILMKELGSGAFTGYGLFQRFGNTNSQVACELNNISPSSRAVVRTNNEWMPGTFHHVACVYAGTSLASGITLYVDGVAQATTVLSDTLTGSLLNTSPIQVSGRGGANFQSTATIDEPRISKSALPAGWIAAEYSNQSNPGAFFTTVMGLANAR